MGPIETSLQEIIGQVSQHYQAEAEELEIMSDHVHLQISVEPPFGIHRLMMLNKKGWSSRLLRQEFPVLKRKQPSLWTNSYFVGTSRGAPLSLIKQ